MPPHVLVLRAPGTNCDQETARAFEQAGAVAQRVHVRRLIEEPRMTEEFQILCIPGGFSYGDDIAAGKILAGQIALHLAEQIQRFRDAGKLILGICNGFQVLLKSGLLLAGDDEGPVATLTWNDSGRFEARWVRLSVDGSKCLFFTGMQSAMLPVAHAEGKFVARHEQKLAELDRAGHFVARYRPWHGDGTRRVAYPDNPNGSQENVAAVCDTTGRILGMMPHPERFVHPTHHPHWTRHRPDADGLRIFQNAVRCFL